MTDRITSCILDKNDIISDINLDEILKKLFYDTNKGRNI